MSVSLSIEWPDGKEDEVFLGSLRQLEEGWAPIAIGLGLELIPRLSRWIQVTPENLNPLLGELAVYRAELVRIGLAYEEDVRIVDRLHRRAGVAQRIGRVDGNHRLTPRSGGASGQALQGPTMGQPPKLTEPGIWNHPSREQDRTKLYPTLPDGPIEVFGGSRLGSSHAMGLPSTRWTRQRARFVTRRTAPAASTSWTPARSPPGRRPPAAQPGGGPTRGRAALVSEKVGGSARRRG